MPLKTTPDEAVGVNLTPMIDVVFLLVIFFMVATKFREQERNIELELPTATAAGDSTPPPDPQVVAIFADGHIELDSQVVSLDELTTQLRQSTAQSDDVQVVIHGDAHCHFQHIAAALAACREARVSDLGITVEIAAAGGTIRR